MVNNETDTNFEKNTEYSDDAAPVESDESTSTRKELRANKVNKIKSGSILVREDSTEETDMEILFGKPDKSGDAGAGRN